MIEEKKKSSQKGNNPLSLKKWIFHNKKRHDDNRRVCVAMVST